MTTPWLSGECSLLCWVQQLQYSPAGSWQTWLKERKDNISVKGLEILKIELNKRTGGKGIGEKKKKSALSVSGSAKPDAVSEEISFWNRSLPPLHKYPFFPSLYLYTIFNTHTKKEKKKKAIQTVISSELQITKKVFLSVRGWSWCVRNPGQGITSHFF